VAGSHALIGARLRMPRFCAWLLTLLFILLTGMGPPAAAQSTGTEIRVNVGGAAYTDSLGRLWSADAGYNTGDAFTGGPPIAGTSDATLFQSGRTDGASAPEMQYAFALPNGWYRVALYFAESHPPAFAVDARVFHVQMEDETVLPSFDIYAEAGANTALVKTLAVEVTDGELNITFLHGPIENPFINAIEIVSRQGPATQEPTMPTKLSAGAASLTQVDLSWAQSTDNVAVTGYRVERCQGASCSSFSQIAGPATSSYHDSGLTQATTYRYRVRATDAHGNLSAYSTILNVTTADNTPFTLRVNAGGAAYTDSADQVWSADTGSNTGFTGEGSAEIAGTADQALFQSLRWDPPSAPELEYVFAVPSGRYHVSLYFAETYPPTYAVGARVFNVQLEGATALQNFDIFAEAGASAALIKTTTVHVTDGELNITFLHGPSDSPFVNAIEAVKINSVDGQPPSVPGGLLATPISTTQVDVQWSAASDNVAVTGYRLERCKGASCSDFTEIATPSGTSFSDTALASSKVYRYRIRSADAAANLSNYSPVASAATPGLVDAQPPSAPTGLTTTADSSTQIRLNWVASTDNIRVTGYRIERCAGVGCSSFGQIGTSIGTMFNDNGVNGGATYRYRVRAFDAASNVSEYSVIVGSTTPGAADVQAPTVPAGLTATPASGAQIDLGWPASTDNVGISGYLVERCQGAACTDFSQVGTSSAPAYGDSGLTPSTTFRYRVRAIDAQNNASGYSPIAAATTLAISGTAGSVSYEYDSFGRLKRVTVVPH
jgi:fibronectin type 3 domain-containing protein